MKNDYNKLSFWLDSLADKWQPRTVLDNTIRADIAIIGAGYTGLWTAYYLKQIDPDLDIVVLEAEIAGFGASGRNGGWCSSHLSGIHRWLEQPQYKDGGLRLQRLMFKTVADVGEVVQRESIDCHFEQSGALDIAVLPVQMSRLQAEHKHLVSLGIGEPDYRWLDAAQTRELIHVNQALGALQLQHCAAIHPARLVRGLAECVERLGVKIYEHSPVVSLNGKDISTRQGKVIPETTLVTTEGYTRGLADDVRNLIPVHSMMVATEPLSPEQLETTGLRHRHTFGNGDRVVTYGQLTADGRIAFGCRGSYLFGSKVREEFKHTDDGFELVRNTLLRFFPGLEGVRFTHSWGGAMGVSRSLQASVNFDLDKRLGWAGGYFGNGVAATHLAGQTLADLVMGRDTDRVHTPWVNPLAAKKKWEPEPLRWLGISYARSLMTLADHLEYQGGGPGAVCGTILDRIRPDL